MQQYGRDITAYTSSFFSYLEGTGISSSPVDFSSSESKSKSAKKLVLLDTFFAPSLPVGFPGAAVLREISGVFEDGSGVNCVDCDDDDDDDEEAAFKIS